MKKVLIAILGLGFMAGCSSQSPAPTTTEKPQPKAVESISGRSAFYKCYPAARGWAADAQAYLVESEATVDSKGHDGKAKSWRVLYASPQRRASKPYMWSAGDISFSPDDTYSPSNSSTHVFDPAYFKIDSDQALDVAQKNGGSKLLETEPDTPIFYLLTWDNNRNALLWHVIYGASRNEAKLRIAVNASSGDFLRVEK
jgi:hypothetical protein